MPAGATVAIVNAEGNSLDSFADFVLAGNAGEILPRLL